MLKHNNKLLWHGQTVRLDTYCALLHFLLLGGKSHDQDVFSAGRLLLLLLELLVRLLQPRHVGGWGGDNVKNTKAVHQRGDIQPYRISPFGLNCGRCTYNIDRHILSPGLGCRPHAVSTWKEAGLRGRIRDQIFSRWTSSRAAAMIHTSCITPLWTGSSCLIRWGEPTRQENQVGSNLDTMLLTNVNIKARPVHTLTFLGRGSSLVIVSLKAKRNKTMANH